MKQFKRFLCEEEAMGTLEVILISAVLIGAAILFKGGITNLIGSMMDNLADNAIDATN
jgi:hypothetical protein